MALRVLLADESPTIKKAIQLALQDYAVDVRSVNIGVDVLNIAKAFKPDIVFTDVLLQKRNGYDVAQDLKSDPETNHLPVILMWSSFLSLDEAKYKASGANARVEKPFDVNSLRSLVKTLVPRTQAHTLSEYLQFPNLPQIDEVEKRKILEAEADDSTDDFDPPTSIDLPAPMHGAESIEMPTPIDLGSMGAPSAPPKPKTPPPAHNPEAKDSWSMESFQPIGDVDDLEEIEFEEKPLGPVAETEDFQDEGDEDSPWIQKDLSHLQIDPENFADSTATNLTGKPANSLDPNTNFTAGDELQVEAVPPTATFDLETPNDSFVGFERASKNSPSKEDIESYIEDVIGKSIEGIIREIVPKIAKQVIKEEIKKLTEQED